MKKFFAAVALAALTAGSVAAPTVAIAKEDKKAPKAPKVIPAPPEGKGQIVFFRPGGMGFALGCGVNENGERLSAMGAGKYFILPADPGAHSYTVKSEATDLLTLEVEPGETYYVRCTIKMGLMVGRPNIAPSTAEEFAKASPKLEYVDADDRGPKVAPDPEAPAA